jgi:predicted Holliday junction resolvase-like endonuclease
MNSLSIVYIVAVLIILLLVFYTQISSFVWQVRNWFAKMKFKWMFRKNKELLRATELYANQYNEKRKSKVQEHKDKMNKKGLWW